MSRSSPARPQAQRAPAAGRGKPHTIRIIGGDWKRTPLPVLDLDGLRPTPDRVRETLFNWLGQDLEGRRCLDLFAGSGALGFEAASRGAASVVMVERHPRAAQQLRALKDKLAARAIEIAEADALRIAAGLAPRSFDVVFVDPPFGDAAAFARARSRAESRRAGRFSVRRDGRAARSVRARVARRLAGGAARQGGRRPLSFAATRK